MGANLRDQNDELNLLSMKILIHAGNGRDLLVKSLNELEEDHFSQSKQMLEEAHEEIVKAHGLQTQTLQMEANGQNIRYSTLFCHAQDTLMTAQSEILLGEHLYRLFSKINTKLTN